jgi:hypothetical protein
MPFACRSLNRKKVGTFSDCICARQAKDHEILIPPDKRQAVGLRLVLHYWASFRLVIRSREGVVYDPDLGKNLRSDLKFVLPSTCTLFVAKI